MIKAMALPHYDITRCVSLTLRIKSINYENETQHHVPNMMQQRSMGLVMVKVVVSTT